MQDPCSVWQYCSDGLIFLPKSVDRKRGHLTFAEAVGHIGRKDRIFLWDLIRFIPGRQMANKNSGLKVIIQ